MSAATVVAQVAGANPRWSEAHGAAGQCGVASQMLCDSLRARGYDAQVYCIVWDGDSGIEGHLAVLLDGFIVDLTARQFDATLPQPLVMPVSSWPQLLRKMFGFAEFVVGVAERRVGAA